MKSWPGCWAVGAVPATTGAGDCGAADAAARVPAAKEQQGTRARRTSIRVKTVMVFFMGAFPFRVTLSEGFRS
jgi:hypothetical protein